MNASKEEAIAAYDHVCAIEQVIDEIVQTDSKEDRERLENAIKVKLIFVCDLLEKCQRKLPSEAAYEREKQRRESMKTKTKYPLK
jgi:hypothetical protein